MAYASAKDGTRLYYEEAGSGTPLVFVHEFAGDYRSWEPQMRFFARTFRCIAYNARGFPPSDVPEDGARYSQAHARDDIVAILDHLKLDRAHLIGLSMGGFAVLHTGIGHPQSAAYVRGKAARALGKFGPAAEKLKPELEIALGDPSLEVRAGAAIGLWRLDGRLEPTLKILNEALQSKSTRWDAVAAFAEIGSPARDSLVLLIPLLQNTTFIFRANVSNAIQRIDPQTAERIFREGFSTH
jgi:pimeloyl-ACP methyl ester carboxylesterase